MVRNLGGITTRLDDSSTNGGKVFRYHRQFCVVDGVEFERHTYAWCGSGDVPPVPDGAWFADGGTAPAVLCACGSDCFRVLRYSSGAHELECIECGEFVDVS